jgi:hypothetical protein
MPSGIDQRNRDCDERKVHCQLVQRHALRCLPDDRFVGHRHINAVAPGSAQVRLPIARRVAIAFATTPAAAILVDRTGLFRSAARRHGQFDAVRPISVDTEQPRTEKTGRRELEDQQEHRDVGCDCPHRVKHIPSKAKPLPNAQEGFGFVPICQIPLVRAAESARQCGTAGSPRPNLGRRLARSHPRQRAGRALTWLRCEPDRAFGAIGNQPVNPLDRSRPRAESLARHERPEAAFHDGALAEAANRRMRPGLLWAAKLRGFPRGNWLGAGGARATRAVNEQGRVAWTRPLKLPD